MVERAKHAHRGSEQRVEDDLAGNALSVSRTSSYRAVTTLLEAIALWEGHRARATFANVGDQSALYELEWVVQAVFYSVGSFGERHT